MTSRQGRDLLGVLADHPRRDDVRARLVELDPHNTALAAAAARAAGLHQVEIVTGDASRRGRTAPDRFPQVCGWFEECGFDRRWVSEPAAGFGVGVHRFTGVPEPLTEGTRMFDCVGYDVLRQAGGRVGNA